MGVRVHSIHLSEAEVHLVVASLGRMDNTVRGNIRSAERKGYDNLVESQTERLASVRRLRRRMEKILDGGL